MKKSVFLSLFVLMFSFNLFSADTVHFFKPNYNWAIEIPFNDYQIVEAKVLDTEGTFKVEAFNEKINVIFDIYFEKGSPNYAAVKVRNYYENILKQMGIKMESQEKWDDKNAAFLLYTAKNFVATDPPQDELNGDYYRSKGYTWIDVRFRIQNPKEADRDKIKNLLKKVKFVEAFEPTVEDNLFMGNLYCISQMHEFCYQCLGSAYEKEKKMPSLKKELRIALVENYSNILRLKGDFQKAVEVLDYGLSKDPNYPMYYWVRARILADYGDEDGTVNMLKKAVENREHTLSGEKLPDPRNDDAFKLLGLKESFRVKVTEIFKPLIDSGYYPEKTPKK